MVWIDAEKLISFILSAQVRIAGLLQKPFMVTFSQDSEGGGIADRPGNMVDVFHTLFGVAGKIKCCFGNLGLRLTLKVARPIDSWIPGTRRPGSSVLYACDCN